MHIATDFSSCRAVKRECREGCKCVSDAIIIGAGVIGNSIATELSRNGWRTLNVDKLPGAGQGSTGYSSGICRTMYSLLDSVRFAWEGYTYFDNWEEHIGVKVIMSGNICRARGNWQFGIVSPQLLVEVNAASFHMAESVVDDLEPLLGRGVRLPQPLGTIRLFPLLPKVPGSGTEDWLGNHSKDGATPGGATALGLALRGLGFSAVLLDSFFDDRHSTAEWLGSKSQVQFMQMSCVTLVSVLLPACLPACLSVSVCVSLRRSVSVSLFLSLSLCSDGLVPEMHGNGFKAPGPPFRWLLMEPEVSDILAALAYLQSRNFPPPYHLYGQRQGASTILRLFAASACRDVRAREAIWALSSLSSCVCEGAVTIDDEELRWNPDFSPLQRASEQGRLPPLLLLASEAAAPAAQLAASAMGGESVEEYERLQLDSRRHVDCLVECRVTDGSVRCIARTYTAVKDKRGQKLKDDSDEEVSTHMSTMAYAWLQRFDPEIWQEAGDLDGDGDELAEDMPDPHGLARLRRCGALVLRSEASQQFLDRVIASHDAVGLPYENWEAPEVMRRLNFDLQSYGPQVRIDDDAFGEPRGKDISGGVFFPTAGYVSDPMLAARNLQTAAEATGRAEFLFGETVSAIRRVGGRIAGISCASGLELDSPVVINVAGPHSAQVTRLAFEDPAENDMAISTRPMRQEVAYVNPPPGISWDEDGPGLICTDLDVGVYFRHWLLTDAR
eukprot:s2790_g8.t1